MLPPITKAPHGGKAELQAPLGKWTLWVSFDSASQCNAARDRMLTLDSQNALEHPDPAIDQGNPPAWLAADTASMCIASDDPRLAK